MDKMESLVEAAEQHQEIHEHQHSSTTAPITTTQQQQQPQTLTIATTTTTTNTDVDKEYFKSLIDSDNNELVVIEDHGLVPDALFIAMGQLKRAYLIQSDQYGPYKKRPIGFIGLCCKYCAGSGVGAGRYFPDTLRNLMQSTTSQTIIKHVSTKCLACPPHIRQAVIDLQQMKTPPRTAYGSRKVFFQRVWSRLHNTKSVGLTEPAPSLIQLSTNAQQTSTGQQIQQQQQMQQQQQQQHHHHQMQQYIDPSRIPQQQSGYGYNAVQVEPSPYNHLASIEATAANEYIHTDPMSSFHNNNYLPVDDTHNGQNFTALEERYINNEPRYYHQDQQQPMEMSEEDATINAAVEAVESILAETGHENKGDTMETEYDPDGKNTMKVDVIGTDGNRYNEPNSTGNLMNVKAETLAGGSAELVEEEFNSEKASTSNGKVENSPKVQRDNTVQENIITPYVSDRQVEVKLGETEPVPRNETVEGVDVSTTTEVVDHTVKLDISNTTCPNPLKEQTVETEELNIGPTGGSDAKPIVDNEVQKEAKSDNMIATNDVPAEPEKVIDGKDDSSKANGNLEQKTTKKDTDETDTKPVGATMETNKEDAKQGEKPTEKELPAAGNDNTDVNEIDRWQESQENSNNGGEEKSNELGENSNNPIETSKRSKRGRSSEGQTNESIPVRRPTRPRVHYV